MSDSQPYPADGGAPRLEARIAESIRVCRCGTRIARGGRYFGVGGLPGSLEELFHGEAFCSPTCVRACFLEDLSVLESITSPAADRQVSDLREVYIHLSSAFLKLFDAAKVEPERSQPAAPGAPSKKPEA